MPSVTETEYEVVKKLNQMHRFLLSKKRKNVHLYVSNWNRLTAAMCNHLVNMQSDKEKSHG